MQSFKLGTLLEPGLTVHQKARPALACSVQKKLWLWFALFAESSISFPVELDWTALTQPQQTHFFSSSHLYR